MTQAINVTPAERQSAKVLVDNLEQRLGGRQTEVDLGRITTLGVVRHLTLLVHITVTRAAEGLNGKDIALLHLGLVAALDDGHALGAVDAVVVDGMAVQVADGLDGKHLTVDLDLVALHDLLDDGANVAHAHVDTGLLDTSVGGGLDGLEKRVVAGVEGDGESAVDDAAVDVHTEIHLHDVVLLKNHLVAGVGGVVRRAVVDGQTSRETHTGDEGVTLLETSVASQGTNAILDVLGDLGQGLAGLDALLRPLANLSVNLGGMAVVGKELLVGGKVVEMALLLVGDALQVVVGVFDFLALGVLLVGEEL